MKKNKNASSKNLQTLFFYLNAGYVARLKWWKKDQFVYFDSERQIYKLNNGQIFSFSVDDEKKANRWYIGEKFNG